MKSTYFMPPTDQKVIEQYESEFSGLVRKSNRNMLQSMLKQTLVDVAVALIPTVAVGVVALWLRFPMWIVPLTFGSAISPFLFKAIIEVRNQQIEDIYHLDTDPLVLGVLLEKGSSGSRRSRRLAIDAAYRLLANAESCRPYHFRDKAISSLLKQMEQNSTATGKLRYIQALRYIGDSRVIPELDTIINNGNSPFWSGMAKSDVDEIRIAIERVMPCIVANDQLLEDQQKLLRPTQVVEQLLRPAAGNSTDAELLVRAETSSEEGK